MPATPRRFDNAAPIVQRRDAALAWSGETSAVRLLVFVVVLFEALRTDFHGFRLLAFANCNSTMV